MPKIESHKSKRLPGWTATIHRNWDFSPEVHDFWLEIAHLRGDYWVFHSPDFQQVWWDAFGEPDRLFVIVIRCQDRITGVIPLSQESEPGKPDFLRSISTENHFAFLSSESDLEQTLGVFVELVKTLNLRVWIERLPADEPATLLVEKCFSRARVPHWKYQEAWAPYVDMSSQSWEEYEATLGSKLRNNLRKGRRRADSKGALSFQMISTAAEAEAAMDELFEIEGSGWKRHQGNAILASQGKQSWYRGLVTWAAGEGLLSIFVMKLDERIVAYDLGLTVGSTYLALKTAYSQEFASQLSAGNLMRHELLHRLWSDRRHKKYDFLGRFDPWKSEWANTANAAVSLMLFPPTIRGWSLYQATYGWKGHLKKFRATNWMWRRFHEKPTARGTT